MLVVMALSVMKSKVFFLVIVLLICSSYANDDIADQVSNVHRKLSLAGDLVGAAAKSIGKTLPKSGPRETLPLDGPDEAKLYELGLKKATEYTAERFFGADAKQGFRLGWKIGKKYYSVANYCEKYANENLQCDNSTLHCESSQSVTCVPYCVVEIVKGIINDTACCEKNGVPEETPCISSNGTIYLGSTPITYKSAPTKCMS